MDEVTYIKTRLRQEQWEKLVRKKSHQPSCLLLLAP